MLTRPPTQESHSAVGLEYSVILLHCNMKYYYIMTKITLQ